MKFDADKCTHIETDRLVMMQRAIFVSTCLALVFGLNACLPAGESIDADVDVLATQVAQTLAVHLQPTDLPTAIASGAPEPTPDRFLWKCDLCGGETIWVFGDGEPYEQDLPIRLGEFFGWDRDTHRILYAEAGPTHGAGPGDIAVVGVSVLDFSDGTIETLFDDNIVEARWVPIKGGVAYILVTQDTYELRWRSPEGLDYLLARDVTFTWSVAPSGEAIAFTRETGYEIDIDPGLYIVSIPSGDETKVADVDKQGTGSISDQPFWSWDSSQVILSHYGGPDPPRLVWARVDGSVFYDLQIDPALKDQWWYTNSIPFILWHPDGDHFLGVPMVVQGELGGLNPLVLYRLDRDARMLTGALVLDGVQQVVGWAIPGRSVWVRVGGEYRELPVP